MEDNTVVSSIEERLHPWLSAPEQFFTPTDEMAEVFRKSLKELYNKGPGRRDDVGLKSLVVEGFGTEQIWQQLQLQNRPLLNSIDSQLSVLVKQMKSEEPQDSTAKRKKKSRQRKVQVEPSRTDKSDDFDEESEDLQGPHAEEEEEAEEAKDEDEEENENDIYVKDDDDDVDDQENDSNDEVAEAEVRDEEAGDEAGQDSEDDEKGPKLSKEDKERNIRSLDEEFFSVEAMEKFADHMEALDENQEEEQDEDDQVDVMQDPGEEGENVTYEGFFDPKQDEVDKTTQGKRVRFQEPEGEEAEDEAAVSGPLSSFQQTQLALRKQIESLEQKIIQPRSWDLVGEVKAIDRPADSLLSTNLEFDHAQKAVEPVTLEVSQGIEAIIRQRILDEAWDDVERKVPVKEKDYVPTQELSQEKSNLGLAELYEKEYLELSRTDGSTEAQDKLNEQHHEISLLVAGLFHKLDALSNFHFTPKPPREEVEIRAQQTPAIAMEEVLPMAVSQEEVTAPQDLYKDKDKGQPRARSEMTQEERQGFRRGKKRKFKAREKAREVDEKEQRQAREREMGLREDGSAADTKASDKDKEKPRRKKERLSVREKKKVASSIDRSQVRFGKEASTAGSFGTSSKVFELLSQRQTGDQPQQAGGKKKKQRQGAVSSVHSLKL